MYDWHHFLKLDHNGAIEIKKKQAKSCGTTRSTFVNRDDYYNIYYMYLLHAIWNVWKGWHLDKRLLRRNVSHHNIWKCLYLKIEVSFVFQNCDKMLIVCNGRECTTNFKLKQLSSRNVEKMKFIWRIIFVGLILSK